LPGSALVERTTERLDPSLPVGWGGDVALVIARPRLSPAPEVDGRLRSTAG
jgi:hypothetical protein